MDILNNLNNEQKQAVMHMEGPCLVLAGAGSGKTKVLTTRIANMINEGIYSGNILAITFTNKAAKEMRDRISLVVENNYAFVGTFHSFGLRIIRENVEKLGLTSNFTIIDSDDALSIIKKIMKEFDISTKDFSPSFVRNKISFIKNEMLSDAEVEKFLASPPEKVAAKVYFQYEKVLRKNNAVDFDDLLKRPVMLFLENEDILFKEFGINAELIIDHAWGYEPTLISDVKSYKPKARSISQGQVLCEGYSFNKARIVIKEMIDALSLDLVEKGLLTNQITLMIGYDRENLKNPEIADEYRNLIDEDYLGVSTIKASHKSINLEYYTSSTTELIKAIDTLFEQIADKRLKIKRLNMSANNLIKAESYNPSMDLKQVTLFDDIDLTIDSELKRKELLDKEYKLQKTIINVKEKYGRNSLLKGMSLEDGATSKERNEQIGGHRS